MAPEDRRNQLLRAARVVFGERGYHQAGVSHIIRVAGVARGTFYNYFESKRAIFQAVLEEVMDEVAGVILPIDIAKSIPAQARANVRRVMVAAMQPNVSRLLFAEAMGLDDLGNKALADFYEAAFVRIELALRTGHALGIVRNGDLRVRSEMMLGMVKEPLYQASLRGETPNTDRIVHEVLSVFELGLLELP
jgi:AcrR family transcriptional regulator